MAGALWAEFGLGIGLEFVLDDRSKPSAELVRNGFFCTECDDDDDDDIVVVVVGGGGVGVD